MCIAGANAWHLWERLLQNGLSAYRGGNLNTSIALLYLLLAWVRLAQVAQTEHSALVSTLGIQQLGSYEVILENICSCFLIIVLTTVLL